jgi:hypothetical protein
MTFILIYQIQNESLRTENHSISLSYDSILHHRQTNQSNHRKRRIYLLYQTDLFAFVVFKDRHIESLFIIHSIVSAV